MARLSIDMTDISRPIGAGKRKTQSALAISRKRIATPRRDERIADFTTVQIAVLFVVLAAITSIPILAYPWPPLSDYINHLARMHVIAAINADPDLSRFYEVHWQVIPNLMMDMIVPALERLMDVFAAGQVFTITSFVLILSGTLALNRRLHGHWSVTPLIAFPLLYNNVFLVGTMNYVFGIGLSLWALVVWMWLRERPMGLRLAVSTAFVVALFFCHLYAVGIYGIGLLAFELNRLRERYMRRPHARFAIKIEQRPSPIVDFFACGLAFIPVLPLLMMSSTLQLGEHVLWELSGKLDGLIYVFHVYSMASAIALAALMVLAFAWGARYRALSFHPVGWMLLAVGALIYLAMPRIVFDTYMADQRLPISLVFMLIACANLNLRYDRVRVAFATVLVVLLAVRVFEVQTVWADLSRNLTSFQDSVRHIDRGTKVMVAYADPDGGDDVRDLGLVHAACLATIERSALVTTLFTVVGKQILHVRHDYRDRVDTEDGTPPTMARMIQVSEHPHGGDHHYWARWTSDYDYLYVLFTKPDYRNPDPAHLMPIYAGTRFVLYRVNPPKLAYASRQLLD